MTDVIYGPNIKAMQARYDQRQKEIALTGGSSDYYKLPPEATDLQDLIEHKEMNFAIGNIFKACYRMGEKTTIDTEYDLDKIIWFANREKKRLKKQKGS